MSATRALILRDYGRLELTEIEIAEPGATDVVVRVAATGICGSDVHGYTGDNGRRLPGQVMGHETAGTVEAVGSEVTSLAVGDRVTINPVMIPDEDRLAFTGREQHCPRRVVLGVAADVPAAFADRVVVPAANIVPLDDALPLELGALIEPLAVAVHAVARVGDVSGLDVLVGGGGPIGQSLILALRDAGVRRVIISEPDAARRELCKRIDAQAIDPTEGSVAEQVAATFGHSADIAFDAVGVSQTLSDAVTSTEFGARVCLVGMGSPNIAVDAYRVSTEERTIIGSFCYSNDHFRAAATLAARETEALFGLVSEEVGPDGADDAFQRLLGPRGAAGKILVRFDR
ncbi:MAG: alcohol dehydrogenase catalytic domain-containing protein [Microbacterium sp.]